MVGGRHNATFYRKRGGGESWFEGNFFSIPLRPECDGGEPFARRVRTTRVLYPRAAYAYFNILLLVFLFLHTALKTYNGGQTLKKNEFKPVDGWQKNNNEIKGWRLPMKTCNITGEARGSLVVPVYRVISFLHTRTRGSAVHRIHFRWYYITDNFKIK